MIVNNPSKSLRSIAKEMGISEFLIKQVLHEYIQYLSYKGRKGPFFLYHRPWRNKRNERAAKLLNKLNHLLQPNMPKSDDEFTEQLACFVPSRCPVRDGNQIPSSNHSLWMVTNDGDVTTSFIFPQLVRNNTEIYRKGLEKTVCPSIEGRPVGRPYFWKRDYAPWHTSRRIQY